ncbi:pyocin knob domain-containing protein [Bradyrhizobium barranii subsp. apii]|uniref:pyocin knob domain-containing protein n=1 Tax=Bradyrhizobium barranii TaxID=2992140 RepID=UPI001AA1A434|nr:pyocin knob domain-containing protein [Bradyrhizobium barranii]UPT95383.1 pyocin knob domain-containing protein [Bradyrhizobium barranii subsp. apii]
MARRFDAIYRVKPKDNLGDPEYWNRRFDDIDRRVSSNEDGLETIGGLTSYIEGLALNRLDLVLAPALDKITLVSEQGFLLAHSNSSVTLDVNATQTFAIADAAERELFAPSPYLTITRAANQTDFAFAKLISWNKVSGQLVVQPLQIMGNPGPFTDWVIYVGTAISQAVATVLQQTQAARDMALNYRDASGVNAGQTTSDKNAVALMRSDTLAARDAAIQAATNAAGFDPSHFLNFDTVMSLNATQKDQGRSNLGIIQTRAIPDSTDWNTLKTPGTYYTLSPTGATNTPTAPSPNYWYLTVDAYGANPTQYVRQVATLLDTYTNSIVYVRVLGNNIWGPWRRVVMAENNLVELSDKAAARTNLGLGTSATRNIATSAEIKNNTNGGAITVDQAWTASAFAPLGDTGSGTLNVDLNNGSRQYWRQTGNVTVGAPTNPRDGAVLELVFYQDGTGGRTLSWNGVWKFPDGVAPVLYTGATAVSVVVTATYFAAYGYWLAAAWKIS